MHKNIKPIDYYFSGIIYTLNNIVNSTNQLYITKYLNHLLHANIEDLFATSTFSKARIRPKTTCTY